MDMMGPFQFESIRVTLVVVDDFSWIAFLRHKTYAVNEIVGFFSNLQREICVATIVVRSDHDIEILNR